MKEHPISTSLSGLIARCRRLFPGGVAESGRASPGASPTDRCEKLSDLSAMLDDSLAGAREVVAKVSSANESMKRQMFKLHREVRVERENFQGLAKSVFLYIDALDASLRGHNLNEFERQITADLRAGLAARLRSFGIRELRTKPGESFDPKHHRIEEQREDPAPANTVLEVLAPGFEICRPTASGQETVVLRTADIVISSGPPDPVGAGKCEESPGEPANPEADSKQQERQPPQQDHETDRH